MIKQDDFQGKRPKVMEMGNPKARPASGKQHHRDCPLGSLPVVSLTLEGGLPAKPAHPFGPSWQSKGKHLSREALIGQACSRAHLPTNHGGSEDFGLPVWVMCSLQGLRGVPPLPVQRGGKRFM